MFLFSGISCVPLPETGHPSRNTRFPSRRPLARRKSYAPTQITVQRFQQSRRWKKLFRMLFLHLSKYCNETMATLFAGDTGERIRTLNLVIRTHLHYPLCYSREFFIFSNNKKLTQTGDLSCLLKMPPFRKHRQSTRSYLANRSSMLSERRTFLWPNRNRTYDPRHVQHNVGYRS